VSGQQCAYSACSSGAQAGSFDTCWCSSDSATRLPRTLPTSAPSPSHLASLQRVDHQRHTTHTPPRSTYHSLCGNGNLVLEPGTPAFKRAVCVRWLHPVLRSEYPRFAAWMLYGRVVRPV
jgi:hypothetical protein